MRAFILLWLLVFSFKALSQDSLVTPLASFKLPEGSKQLSEQEYVQEVQKVLPIYKHRVKDDHMYKLGNILISIHQISFAPNSRKTLERIKKEMDASTEELDTKFDRSEIKVFNGKRFLITAYRAGGQVFVNFTSDVYKDKSVGGQLICAIPEQQKAYEHLTSLLETARLKLPN